MSFLNVFQDGSSGVEIFSPSGTNPFQNVLIQNPNCVQRDYDRSMKGYVVSVFSKGRVSTKVQIPKKQGTTLGLKQRFICFQVCLAEESNFSVEFLVTDSNNCRRRIGVSTAQKVENISPLHILLPLPKSQMGGGWITLVIDFSSIFSLQHNTNLKSLDCIFLYPCCKVRKIFTLPVYDGISSIPPSYHFPVGVAGGELRIPSNISKALPSLAEKGNQENTPHKKVNRGPDDRRGVQQSTVDDRSLIQEVRRGHMLSEKEKNILLYKIERLYLHLKHLKIVTE